MVRDTLRIVAHNVGHLMLLIAWLPLVLVPIALYYGEWRGLVAAVSTALVMLVTGLALRLTPAPREPRLREGMMIAAVGWLLVPLASMVQFMIGEQWPVLNAYFECMSAWTGTGMTLADVTVLSNTTLAWRSVMQWVGGLGVIVLTLSILARPGTGAFSLYASEGREEKLRPSVMSTVRTLWTVYVLYTVLAFVLFLLVAGLPTWDAFNHALTGIATGGMSINPGSIGDYGSPRVEAVAMLVMLLGGIAFVAHYALLNGRWRAFLRDEQLRAMGVVILIAFPTIAYFLVRGLPAAEPAVREALFQVVSAVTTTGWQTADIAVWPERAKFAIAGLMLLGGAAGSTAGGIKLVRASLLVRGAFWKLERAGLPHFAVTRFRWGGKNLTQSEANEEFAEAAFIVVLWIVMLFLGVIVMLSTLPTELPLDDILFDIASATGNVGLGTGVIGAALPDVTKIALIGIMWAARLEILPVLLILRALLPKLRRRTRAPKARGIGKD